MLIRAVEGKKREYLSLFSSNVALSYRKPPAWATPVPLVEPNFSAGRMWLHLEADPAQITKLLKEMQPNSAPLDSREKRFRGSTQ